MFPDLEKLFEKEINRSRFLKGSLSALGLSLLPPGFFCSVQKAPGLKGLGLDAYNNINSVAEVFLKGSPVKNFNTGKALDKYLYEKPLPPATEKKLLLLLMLPSSILISIAFDFSLTPLSKLSEQEREKRLKAWKHSSFLLKKTAYAAFRQLSFLLLSSSAEYQSFAGYTKLDYFRPYS